MSSCPSITETGVHVPLQAALFDLDDTLSDHQHSRRAGLSALQTQFPCFESSPLIDLIAAHERHLQMTHVLVLDGRLSMAEARRERMRRLFDDYGHRLEDGQVDAAEDCYRAAYDINRRAVPGVRELLIELRRHLRIVVVTNGLVAEQTKKLSVCGVTSFVDALVTSQEAGVKKPDPRIFALALERAGCTADAAIVVGDSWKLDIVGARAAGLRSIWLNRLGEVCPEAGVTTEIASFEPLAEVAPLFAAFGSDRVDTTIST